ncbi:CmpA/NrtA family ABC transporter substrate-binding protein [Nesterenkonia flava]|uniref:CmpA/NrtA family ABC transporter substrate-binding protein n=1 Tax=Nesterenkonia flava TaxID=469799 RepID=A0ABU1FTY4_9MICC|nr:CmpA/NrtA family ABC transporter substrate-binding protein [Nesterenkonia flava]MDR5712120.1 CmpA/NrtA family ABC transporter substrate-binding protein [Nesterenkonia flava]
MDALSRRGFLAGTGAVSLAGLLTGCRAFGLTGADGGGSGERAGDGARNVTLGFIALTDFAALAVAEINGYFAERDLNVLVRKETSWATTRDNLQSGEIDGAHCLYSMPLSVACGIGGNGARDMRIAMMLNNNGQAISLTHEHFPDVGYGDIDAAAEVLRRLSSPTLAMTFPGGTHDLWIEYWLKAMGLDPRTDVTLETTPPPEMVANAERGEMVAYCVGEPWPGVTVSRDIGRTHLATQDLWTHHPEKALVVNQRFSEERQDVLRDVMGAILQASAWLDDLDNRAQAAELISPQDWVNAPVEDIESRLLGAYDFGDGTTGQFDATQMMYHSEGFVNLPRKSHALWALAQYQRFGYLNEAPDYSMVDELMLTDLYHEVAEAEGLEIPDDDMEPFEVVLDGVTFDPHNPDEEAARP